MQPKTKETASGSVMLQTQGIPKIFKFYEEYSKNDVLETVKNRRIEYEKATLETKIELQSKVEAEVKDFCTWLRKTKHLEPSIARYSSIALKSVLLGLPTGEQIAELFSIVLNDF